MKTLTIDDTLYNLAFLISVRYKAKTKATALRRAKSASSLDLQFLDCDPIHLRKAKADAVWGKLSASMNLDPSDSFPL